MGGLYNTCFINWAPYSKEKTQIPDIDFKSSEYVYCCVIDAIRNKKPFSVIRMGDGEAGCMSYYKTGIKPNWMGKWWFERVGIKTASDAKLKELGKFLIFTANNTDFLGSTIWGSSKTEESWNIDKFINRHKEKPRCSSWFNMEWYVTGCIHNLVSNFSFGVLHKDEDTESILRNTLAKDPRFNGKLAQSGHFVLKTDADLNNAEKFIKNTNFDVYLVSGGPTGKIWMYTMSRKYNKVIIDAGSCMSRCWARKCE